jgi:hypothetical protein
MRACLALLALLAGCAPAVDLRPSMAFDDNVVAAPSAPPPSYSGPAFFPVSLAEPTINCPWSEGRLQPILGDFARNWYSLQLAAAAEPSLYLAAQGPRPADGATLRFTWLRSFHHPVTIRIETTGPGRHRLVAKQLSGAGGYDPGHVDRTLDRALTPDEAGRLAAMLARTRIFDLAPDPCGGGADGAQWIFEGVDAGGYHFVDRWTPREGAANELGRFLMSLTGWEFGAVY